MAAVLLGLGHTVHLCATGAALRVLKHEEGEDLDFAAPDLARLFDPAFLPFFVLLPLLGIALIVQLFRSLALGQEVWPFVYTVLLFVLSFAGLGVMVFPAIIPPSITIFEASSSVTSMVFMLTFIGVLIPIMLFYNIYNYIAFRGKVDVELDKALATHANLTAPGAQRPCPHPAASAAGGWLRLSGGGTAGDLSHAGRRGPVPAFPPGRLPRAQDGSSPEKPAGGR